MSIILILLVLLFVWGIMGIFAFRSSIDNINTTNNYKFTLHIIKHGPFVWLGMLFLLFMDF
jgi:flagellar basal body-associated protein FliL